MLKSRQYCLRKSRFTMSASNHSSLSLICIFIRPLCATYASFGGAGSYLVYLQGMVFDGIRGLPLITYASRGWGWVKPSIQFYCALHAKRGERVQIACKTAYVINGRPLTRYGMVGLLYCFTMYFYKNYSIYIIKGKQASDVGRR